MSDRQRRYRRRQRQGLAVYRVSGDDHLLHALIKLGLLKDEDTLIRGRVEDALTAVLQEWAQRWTNK